MLPALFVSHGAPTLALEDSPTGRFLDALGATLPRPRAIVVASAHFLSDEAIVGGAPRPATMHDFGGFPEALRDLRYRAPGDTALAAAIAARLEAAGIPAWLDGGRGLDHGVWVPLRRAYPQADIPVVPLAVAPRRDARWHFRLGAALASWRADGVLVIGSGGYTHNLRALDWQAPPGAGSATARAFATWFDARLQAGDVEAAMDWALAAPGALANHPTPEHLLPLFVAWGAAGGAPATPLHRAWAYGSLALDAWRFGP